MLAEPASMTHVKQRLGSTTQLWHRFDSFSISPTPHLRPDIKENFLDL